ncbi:MAG: guanylate kinase [Gammaproteobacteria bacterium]|nr:MAG: guanylate kinase [Gammaproteobacteria bacterium]
MSNRQSGLIFVFAAPSGGGKSSLVKALLERDPNIVLSVSHTTRSPRPGEQDGVHYHFVSPEEFLRKKEKGDFIETAEVFGNYYGTSRQAILDKTEMGKDVALDIDWQGARQIRQLFPQNSFGIYILPPSMDILEQRLRNRGQDDEETIRYRMQQAEEELSHQDEFDFKVVNDEFEKALQEIQYIVSRCRMDR